MLLALELGSCFIVPNEPDSIDFPEIRTGEVTYHVEEVKRQDLLDSVTVYGQFQPTLRKRLFFEFSGGKLLYLDVDEGDHFTAGQVLATLNVSGLENQIELQEIAMEKAKIRYALQDASGSNKYERRIAELDVLSAEILLADKLEKLANSRIIAPFDGVVTRIGAEVGDFVNAFVPLISVESPDTLRLECDPKSAQRLWEGMEVEVEMRDKSYMGIVTRSYRDIIALGLEALDNERVWIEVAGIPADTQSGETARVTAVTAEARNAVVIKKNLVKNFGDRTFVYLLRDQEKVDQDVVIGLETRLKVEILDGLSEGDQLIVK